MRSDKLEKPELYPFPVDRVLCVLGKRLSHFKEWQRIVAALETGLDPPLARRFPPSINSLLDDISDFVRRVVKEWVQTDTSYRVAETKSNLDEKDTNAFALYKVLLPAGSINYPLPNQFIQEIEYLRLESIIALIRMGLAKQVGSDRLVLTEHPFQIRQILKLEENGQLSVPTELGRWFNHKVRRSSLQPTLSGAVLAGYLADQSQAGTHFDDLIHHAEWSGVRQPVADALKLLLEHTDWNVDAAIKEKATAAYHPLTRRLLPEDEEQFVDVLKSQQAYWKGLQEGAERSGELKVGSERLDRILYEIAYIDYLLESYDQAADTFGRSVDAALEAIARGMQARPDDPARKDGSDALAKFWVSAVLEKSAALRHHIRQCLIEGEAAAHQRTNTGDMSCIVKETASIWRQLQQANGQPKKHEIKTDVPGPQENLPGLPLPIPEVGLPFYRAQGIDLLGRWTQHSKPSELSDAALAITTMRRAGGSYEYIGDLLLLAWRCTPSSETADMLKWYLLKRIPDVGFNGISKIALEKFGERLES